MKRIYLLATALAALVSCTSDDFMGDSPGTKTVEETTGEGIAFAGGFKAVTRANSYGADAADLLGNQFVVLGVKGDGTGKDQTDVFKNYAVQWTANTAGKTESNTADWEYVGVTPISGITGVTTQTIKFWDYSTTAYDFAAFSAGKGNTIISADPSPDPIPANSILATPITYAVSTPSATTTQYTLKGSREDLAECYITDMKTVAKANYNKEVELEFRSLATKVRMAIYETVPGYSVKDVKFYSTDQGATIASENYATATSATLIGAAFYSGGKYTVTFPTIGSSNSGNSDYEKAHVSIEPTGETATTQTFGTLNYAAGEDALSGSTVYLKRTSIDPSFAGTGTYYKSVLPKEDGTVLEMCVDYTLVSNDGSGEEITVHGAKAFVPAVYTKWLPNYAYTYIFKISDNTNGYTNPNGEDPAGLYPITFDAIVLDSEETGHQTTITTVSTPSITTYQKGHVYSASNEYKVPTSPNATAAASNDAIYAQVMNNETLVTDLNSSEPVKSFFYKLSETAGKTYESQPTGWPTGYYTDPACSIPASGTFSNETPYYTKGPWSEANVMDALNIQESETSGTIVGRNGITLTPATAVYDVVKIPGEDGNWIEKYNASGTATPITAGMVAKLSPNAAGTYAFVYDYTTSASTTDVYTAVQLTGSKPADFASKYYKKTGGDAYTACVDADYKDGGYFYIKYTDLNHTYAVKVIKVVSGS